MSRDTIRSAYLRGMRGGGPFILVVVPFAMMFGVVATKAGLSLFETLSFSVVVIAGASQFTALQLMGEDAPTLVVIASALAVNLRMAMYSASITPHLGPLPLHKRALAAYLLVDQVYAASILDYEARPRQSLSEKFAFFLGVATPICPNWYLFTLVGAWVGEAIPPGTGLDMVLPLAFIAMIGPALRTRAHVGAALSATGLALLMAWLPYNLGLLVAAMGGMVVGAEIERRREAT
ncbi:AzlC family ABC transporter permease [Pseudoponticoccus marisrubri]|uniref:Branched-chain amino acid transporter AzlC n=1 Tax=Pseudoponticoccus marisrubri TaxID=1685382 RepID=A0A0W7WH01_9RHOB|nr:AzlC family ABC transporter permease [Pseudoponticoccus marisrubri]KUF09752.1 branched-chain amino acid transporter AzlC [Pseudoponticoccus marisrubri]